MFCWFSCINVTKSKRLNEMSERDDKYHFRSVSFLFLFYFFSSSLLLVPSFLDYYRSFDVFKEPKKLRTKWIVNKVWNETVIHIYGYDGLPFDLKPIEAYFVFLFLWNHSETARFPKNWSLKAWNFRENKKKKLFCSKYREEFEKKY